MGDHANKFNQFSYGSTVQDYNFPRPSNALGVNQVNFVPEPRSRPPFRRPLLPPSTRSPDVCRSRCCRTTLPGVWGGTPLTFGGTFKWINANSRTSIDYNTYAVGLGGNLAGLNTALGPRTYSPPTREGAVRQCLCLWDWAGSVLRSPTFNYDSSGAALPLATGSIRNYRYYQTQVYGSDTWKVTPHLTLVYGVNYQYFSVPYEKNGLETAQTSLMFDNFIATRVAQSAAGGTAPGALPFLTYVSGWTEEQRSWTL